MNNGGIHERPGLHIEHLRQLVRLRRASGWSGILAFAGLLAWHCMDRMDPDLFRAAVPKRAASSVHHADQATAVHLMQQVHRID